MAKKAGRKSTTSEPPARILKYKLTADELNQLKKYQADLDRDRKIIQRANDIRDGLIPSPWIERLAGELLKAVSAEPKAEPKHTGKGRQMARARAVACKLYPPDGIAPENVKTWQAVRAVQKEHPDISRDVVARAIGRRKS